MQENTVREFLNEVFGEVRAFEEDGQIWFVASDVAKVLEYKETRDVTDRVDKEDRELPHSLLMVVRKHYKLLTNLDYIKLY